MAYKDQPIYPNIKLVGDYGRELRLQGMTLREHYAGLAMQGILSNTNHQWPLEDVVKYSVEYADALIDQLNKESK